jgi:hypothetical protein
MAPNKISMAWMFGLTRGVARLVTLAIMPDYGQLGDNPLGWKKRFEVIAMTQTRSYSL